MATTWVALLLFSSNNVKAKLPKVIVSTRLAENTSCHPNPL
jgi:hypothetical protein